MVPVYGQCPFVSATRRGSCRQFGLPRTVKAGPHTEAPCRVTAGAGAAVQRNGLCIRQTWR